MNHPKKGGMAHSPKEQQAALLCLFSTVCSIFMQSRWATYLKAIGSAILAYAGLTLAVMLSHTEQVPIQWRCYFLAEFLTIALLGWLERHLSTRVDAA